MKKIGIEMERRIMRAIKHVGSAEDIYAVADQLVEDIIEAYERDNASESQINLYLKKMGFNTIKDVQYVVEQYIAFNEYELHTAGYLSKVEARDIYFMEKERDKNESV